MSLRDLFGSFRRSLSKSEPTAAQSHIDWVIIGLGNPDEQYRRSRHNLGFMALDRLAHRHAVRLDQRRFKAYLGRGEIDGRTVMLGEPQTYMNLSGEAVAPILGYFKVKATRLIVIHDELDLDVGTVRIKRGGGHAGNNGIRSIIDSLGTGGFVRVRIGVGKPPQGRDGVSHVIQSLTRDELAAFDPILERAADAVEAVIQIGVERAMNKFNQRA
ncbi:MAG TPA: aminoacyl-tRNA hydrolase [Candidatus Binataceae bacterium]|jgi:PTH1 family peptidyl-tRNA hydrolase|nr:aminoacyl-tRNA hydrolase [Candidatus Binataceae bacterium]